MGLKTFLRTTAAAVIFCTGTSVAAQSVTQSALPDLSADTIARDAQVRLIGGQSVTLLPTFDPFEASGEFAGTAALRESQGEIDRTGARLPDGAVLDLTVIYTSGSDDPYDVRGLEEAVFLSGDFVPSVAYDTRTLECSSRVTDVVYRDDYYAGVSHGLIAGLYMAYPRYRGHRHFHYDLGPRHYRRGGRRAYRHGGYRGHHGRSGGYGYSDHRRRDGRGRRAEDRRDGRVRGDRAERDRGDRDRVVRDGRARDGGGRNREARRDPNPYAGGSYTPGARVGTGVGRMDDRRLRNAPGRDRPAIAGRGAPRSEPLTQRREPVTRTTRERLPQTVREPRGRAQIRQAPQYSKQPAPKRRAEPRRSEPKRSEPKRAPAQRARPQRIDRAMDRSFNDSRRKSLSRGKHLDYYPASTRVETRVDSRCAKEESLSLFIPSERLEAARFDGLTVILLASSGEEIPVFVPPNYVEGYLLATRP